MKSQSFKFAVIAVVLAAAPVTAQEQQDTIDLTQPGMRSPPAAAVLEVVPLLGHWYAGDVKRGILPAGLRMGGAAVAGLSGCDLVDLSPCSEELFLAGLGVGLGGWIWSMVSAYRTASDRNQAIRTRNMPVQINYNVGDRVRITMGTTRVEAEVAAIGQDSIHTTSRSLFGPRSFSAIPWENIDLLERRTGSRWLLGAAIGGGVLAGVGLIAALTDEPCTGDFCISPLPDMSDGEVIVALGGLGSIPGALIGRLFSRWETVETDRAGDMVILPTVDLRLGPQARPRLSIGGHIRF